VRRDLEHKTSVDSMLSSDDSDGVEEMTKKTGQAIGKMDEAILSGFFT